MAGFPKGSGMVAPKKNVRRGPYCVDWTPMPVPFLIWYVSSKRLTTAALSRTSPNWGTVMPFSRPRSVWS